MFPVSSSQISYIGYEDDDMSLIVVFTNGSTYRYDNVPREVFDDLKSASSVGKYFNANIKNSYSNSKIK